VCQRVEEEERTVDRLRLGWCKEGEGPEKDNEKGKMRRKREKLAGGKGRNVEGNVDVERVSPHHQRQPQMDPQTLQGGY